MFKAAVWQDYRGKAVVSEEKDAHIPHYRTSTWFGYLSGRER